MGKVGDEMDRSFKEDYYSRSLGLCSVDIKT